MVLWTIAKQFRENRPEVPLNVQFNYIFGKLLKKNYEKCFSRLPGRSFGVINQNRCTQLSTLFKVFLIITSKIVLKVFLKTRRMLFAEHQTHFLPQSQKVIIVYRNLRKTFAMKTSLSRHLKCSFNNASYESFAQVTKKRKPTEMFFQNVALLMRSWTRWLHFVHYLSKLFCGTTNEMEWLRLEFSFKISCRQVRSSSEKVQSIWSHLMPKCKLKLEMFHGPKSERHTIC